MGLGRAFQPAEPRGRPPLLASFRANWSQAPLPLPAPQRDSNGGHSNIRAASLAWPGVPGGKASHCRLPGCAEPEGPADTEQRRVLQPWRRQGRDLRVGSCTAHGSPWHTCSPGPCTGEKDRRWGLVFPAQKRKAPSGLPQEHRLRCSLGESHWATFPSLGQEESRAQGPRWRPEQARCVRTAVPTPRHGRCPSQPLEHC